MSHVIRVDEEVIDMLKAIAKGRDMFVTTYNKILLVVLAEIMNDTK